MRLQSRRGSIWITWNQWIPWVDSHRKIQYYILWTKKDFYLFQNSTRTYLIHLDSGVLESIKNELQIEGGVINIQGKERQYGSHTWYALELPADGKDWLHTGRRIKIQKILSRIQASVGWALDSPSQPWVAKWIVRRWDAILTPAIPPQ